MTLIRRFSVAASAIGLCLLSGCTTRVPSQPRPGQPPPPTSTATPTPTAIATPDPSPNPSPTPTPTPTATPTPTTQAPATTPDPPPVSRDPVEVLSCTTTMAKVDDPTAPLNVRSRPEVAEGNIVGQLDDGTFVSVVGESDGWWEISDPESGWISKNLTDSSCNQMEARVTFPPNSVSVTLSDRLIGGGTHRYRLNALEGQTMTLRTNEPPLPLVRSPNGSEITDGAGMGNPTTWSGELPATGEYVLEYPSNFRGYDYQTEVEIR